jgi:hypothetical protein
MDAVTVCGERVGENAVMPTDPAVVVLGKSEVSGEKANLHAGLSWVGLIFLWGSR